MRKKGQAAMEFLMTYGWAILAAIIVIGVLAIYLRPSALTPSQVILNAPLYANTWAINGSTIAVEIQNQAGEVINVSSATVTLTSPATTCMSTFTIDYVVNASGLQTLYMPCAVSLGSIGDSVEGTLEVKIKRGGSLATPVTGTLSGSVASGAI